jgi:hypothetical protein
VIRTVRSRTSVGRAASDQTSDHPVKDWQSLARTPFSPARAVSDGNAVGHVLVEEVHDAACLVRRGAFDGRPIRLMRRRVHRT